MKTRSLQPEIMDQPGAAPSVARKFHRDLALIHRLMGNWDAVIERLAAGPKPNSVIDIGCGDGALLREIRNKLHVQQVTGIDLKPSGCAVPEIPIVVADATADPLPCADAAVSVMMLHHLSDEQIVALIANAGRTVKRLICLDPVRHVLPLVLYTVFVCPLLSRVGALDGRQSIRRSFRPAELRVLAERATAGSGAVIDIWVSPIYARQILDIRWPDR